MPAETVQKLENAPLSKANLQSLRDLAASASIPRCIEIVASVSGPLTNGTAYWRCFASVELENRSVPRLTVLLEGRV
jgi:hypothetical protein